MAAAVSTPSPLLERGLSTSSFRQRLFLTPPSQLRRPQAQPPVDWSIPLEQRLQAATTLEEYDAVLNAEIEKDYAEYQRTLEEDGRPPTPPPVEEFLPRPLAGSYAHNIVSPINRLHFVEEQYLHAEHDDVFDRLRKQETESFLAHINRRGQHLRDVEEEMRDLQQTKREVAELRARGGRLEDHPDLARRASMMELMAIPEMRRRRSEKEGISLDEASKLDVSLSAAQGSQAGTTLGSMVASWLDTVASPQGSFQEGNPPDTDSEMDALLRRSIADMHLSQPKYKTPPKKLAGSYLQQYLNRDQYSSGSPSKATSPSPTASQSRVAQLRGDGYATLQRMNSDQIRTQEFLHESIHSRLANPKYWSGVFGQSRLRKEKVVNVTGLLEARLIDTKILEKQPLTRSPVCSPSKEFDQSRNRLSRIPVEDFV